MPKSLHPGLDADLIAFLHDLPEGAADAIGQMMREAAIAGSKKSNRQGWIRLAIYSVISGGIAVGGFLRLANVPTTGDLKELRALSQAAVDAKNTSTEVMNLRLSAAERTCDEAKACCSKQSDRLDRLTTPARLGPY